ncbi:hypothetical protein J6590_044219, partial [Homalodisca vitripennis]
MGNASRNRLQLVLSQDVIACCAHIHYKLNRSASKPFPQQYIHSTLLYACSGHILLAEQRHCRFGDYTTRWTK